MMENEAIEEKTADVLRGLSSSKDSISKAAKFALERRNSASEIFKGFLDRMKKIGNPHHRVPLLYLLDSICQNAKSRNCEEYLELTANNMQIIAQLFLPQDSDTNPAKLINLSKKVFKIWESRGIFTSQILGPVFEMIERAEGTEKKGGDESPSIVGFDEWQQQNKPESISPPSQSKTLKSPSSSKRAHSSISHTKEQSNEEKLKMMEEYRRQTKMARWEERLRPIEDSLSLEFSDWWKKSIDDWEFKQKKEGNFELLDQNKRRKLEEGSNDKENAFRPPSPQSIRRMRKEIDTDEKQRNNNNRTHEMERDSRYSPSNAKNAGFPRSFGSLGSSNSPSNLANIQSPSTPTGSSPKEFLSHFTPEKSKVFVWDLDETLIIFNSLFNDSKSPVIDGIKRRGERESKQAARLGKRMEELIVDILDAHLFYKKMKNLDLVRICELCDRQRFRDDPGGIGRCGSQIEEIYGGRRESYFSHGVNQEINTLYKEIDQFTERWLTTGKDILSLLSSKEDAINVVVTSGNIVAAVAKMIIYQLSPYVPFSNLYCSKNIGKLGCFQMIQEQFRGCSFFVVGDGKDEEEASQQLNIPFFRVMNCKDLKDLSNEFSINSKRFSTKTLKTS
eukprot:TRINITY_DN2144_c0_g1_i1.p1 TRINITY_DN2144_c0_g1~~TRINITY_DN2144_c0_g1_i1.p1  ORF type:complete len:618 (+),score=156.85 TRINITY_DN2144_c0_g1_i1:281-2134(+)